MKLVLDTNVVMELLHWQDPRSARLLAALEGGTAHCAIDISCRAELERVVTYAKFDCDTAAQASLLARYDSLAEAIAGNGADIDLPRCRDRDDQKFLELAARARAAMLVTRDRDLLRLARSRRHPLPFAIVPPEQALDRLFPLHAQETDA